MSLLRYAAKRDLAERAIIDALEDIGWSVWQLDEPADLLCWHRNRGWHVLEVKTARNKRGTVAQDRRQQAQREFLALTGTPIVRTSEEAFRAIGVKIT